MKTSNKTMAMTFAAVALLSFGVAAHAQDLLDVQFAPSAAPLEALGDGTGTGSGFFTDISALNTAKTIGSYTVTATAVGQTGVEGILTRTGGSAVYNQGAFTAQNLFNSDIYANYGAPYTVASTAGFSIVGVTANQQYSLTIWSYDPGLNYGSNDTFLGIDNTTSIGTGNVYNGPTPATTGGRQGDGTGIGATPNGDNTGGNLPNTPTSNSGTGYSTTILVTSTTGTLNIQTTAGDATDQGSMARINGFTLDAIAAPEPSTYALMGLGALALLVVSRRRRTA